LDAWPTRYGVAVSDPRRPTDGELFREYRPDLPVGKKTKASRKKWVPPPLTGARADIFTLAGMLKDRQAAAFVRDLAGWLNKPHGLGERDPDRAAIDKVLRGLLYRVSDGEAEFHRRKLRKRIDEKRAGARHPPSPTQPSASPQEDSYPEVAPHVSPTQTGATATGEPPAARRNARADAFAAYLATNVPRADAMEILRLIAQDVGAAFPDDPDGEFQAIVVGFADAHLTEARTRAFLTELVERQAQGGPWVRPGKRA
jgi:hypothetical protein